MTNKSKEHMKESFGGNNAILANLCVYNVWKSKPNLKLFQ